MASIQVIAMVGKEIDNATVTILLPSWWVGLVGKWVGGRAGWVGKWVGGWAGWWVNGWVGGLLGKWVGGLGNKQSSQASPSVSK